MGECIFEKAGNFILDSYPTMKQLKRTLYAKSLCVNEEFFGTQSTNNQLVHAELNYFDQILQEHHDEPTRTVNETIDYPALDENTFLSGFTVNTKPQLNLGEVSCQLLQKLQEKRVNLVLVATSLEVSDVAQKLKGSLDPDTSSMIPMSFDENNNVIDQVVSHNPSSKPAATKHDSNTNYGKSPKETNQSLRKATAHQKDEKYWKRRTNNNEAARRSREAKSARFAWIKNRTKELEFENASLQQELDSLEKKVLEMEKRAS